MVKEICWSDTSVERKAIGVAKRRARKEWGFDPEFCKTVDYIAFGRGGAVEVIIDSKGPGIEEKITYILDKKTMKTKQSYSIGKCYSGD